MVKNKKLLLLFFSIIVFAISCETYTYNGKTYTYNKRNPYPNMEILKYNNRFAYNFHNKKSDKLIILTEGSGFESVLGVKENGIWSQVGNSAQLLQELHMKYTLLILEKLNRQPGIVYSEDMEDRANYTAVNLLAGYVETVDCYLAEHNFSSIILIGTSEGAMLLPLLYEKIRNKDKVIAMVSIGFGGLSMYESYNILNTKRKGYPQEWLDMFSDILNTFNPNNGKLPNSYEENYYNLTYRWFNSFFHIKPFDYYKNINIPILFVHGMSDYNIPFESTAYIQENLPEKTFQYQYYQWDHQPRTNPDIIQFRKNLAEWIIQVSK
jgi:pimeloyl-ACP methyl ester carboxylesterase